jgi:hypothetical protein
MTKLISAIAALTLAIVPAAAQAEESAPVSFEYAGQTYTYTTEYVGKTRVLRGEVGPRKERFTLRVGKHWVDGTMNGDAVSFPLSTVRPLKGVVVVEQLAVR